MYLLAAMVAVVGLLAPAAAMTQEADLGPESEVVCAGPRPTTRCEPSLQLHRYTQALVNRSFRRDDPLLARLCTQSRVVKLLRPSAGAAGVIMAVNPHPHPDVEVCGGHMVELYVGMPLHQPMPDMLSEPVSVRNALLRMEQAGYDATARCIGSLAAPSEAATVVDQWPQAGTSTSRARKFAGGLQTPGAHVTIWANCETASPCPQPRPCPTSGPSPEPDDLMPAAAGLAGLVGGWVLAQVGRGRSRVPQKRVPAPEGPALPLTRVRPDLETNDETGH